MVAPRPPAAHDPEGSVGVTAKPCAVAGCPRPRWVLRSGRVRPTCHFHELEQTARRNPATATKPCAVSGCPEARWVLESGKVRPRCHEHTLEVIRKSQTANADKPCGVAGCTQPRYKSAKAVLSFCHDHYLDSSRRSAKNTTLRPCAYRGCNAERSKGHSRCIEHAPLSRLAGQKCPRPGCMEPRWDEVGSSYCHYHQLEASRESKRRTGYRADKAKQRRRREAPWTWTSIAPWPSQCCICGLSIDPTIRHGRESMGGQKHPHGETIGHEPPVAWMLAHPEYAGPLILRPEHWSCNSAKGGRPDWEI